MNFVLQHNSTDGKIEVRLCGQIIHSSTTRCDTSLPEYFNGDLGNLKVDFLTFSILRPSSIILPFIRDLLERHVGLIEGMFLNIILWI